MVCGVVRVLLVSVGWCIILQLLRLLLLLLEILMPLVFHVVMVGV